MKLIIPKPSEPASQADPYIIEANGKFYIYSTATDGVNVYSSDNLFDGWEYNGKALSIDGQHEYWAPCVIGHDGKYYMYYSSFSTDTDDVHQGRIKVAVSDTPDGEFKYVCDLCAPFSIDPHVVKNNKGWFIFYSVNDEQAERAGTYVVVDKMLSPFEVEGKPKSAVRPTLDEEIFCRDRFKKGQHWHTLEGAFYFKKDEVHYLMYSGNCYQNENYYVGYATAHGDDDLTALDWQKYPSDDVYAPLICKNEQEEGTGHNSVIEYNGEIYMVYHGRDLSVSSSQDSRTARICKLSIENGVIKIAER